jgi:hypothetical protein
MALAVHYPKSAVQKFLENRFPKTNWAPVIDGLPPIVWRARWNSLADRHGLPFKRGYLENLDSRGIGPKAFI